MVTPYVKIILLGMLATSEIKHLFTATTLILPIYYFLREFSVLFAGMFSQQYNRWRAGTICHTA
jgi:hypothetical protein